MANKIEDLLSLHRYWIYSDKMRILFKEALAAIDKKGMPEVKDDPEGFLIIHMHYLGDFGVFKSYWYGSLFVVIEGYQELGLKLTEMEPLIIPDYVDRLRKYSV